MKKNFLSLTLFLLSGLHLSQLNGMNSKLVDVTDRAGNVLICNDCKGQVLPYCAKCARLQLDVRGEYECPDCETVMACPDCGGTEFGWGVADSNKKSKRKKPKKGKMKKKSDKISKII